LWTHRDWLERFPASIVQICAAVDWGNKEARESVFQSLRPVISLMILSSLQQVDVMVPLLARWPKIHPVNALPLLGYRHQNEKVISA